MSSASILDSSKVNLNLRPIMYPELYDRMKLAIKNTWTVEEIDFSLDIADLKTKLSVAEIHLIQRLVAFFATGDSIVSNNLVLNLYKHINNPEARLYLSRQLWEEAVHVDFYLTLLDAYIPDSNDRVAAFQAVDNISSIAAKAQFCYKWIDSIHNMDRIVTIDHRRRFLLNLICFSSCIEGLFFFAAFAYVFFLRSKGYLHGLASGTNWVFRDESCHMDFAFAVVDIVREEEPELFDSNMRQDIINMINDAVECEYQFAEDLLSGGISGMSLHQMKEYLQYIADQRLVRLGIPKQYGTKNPFAFMELQDVQELTNFFERKTTAYQVNVPGSFSLDEAF